jgi:hypothetical protein
MASEDRILKILLQIQSDISGLTNVRGGLSDVQRQTEATAQSAFGLKQAFEFAGAEEALRRILDVIAEVGRATEDQVKKGVDWLAQVQVVQTQLAGVLLQTQPGQYQNFPAAFSAAGDEVDKLKDKANELGLEYKDMFETFQHIQAVLSSGAGIKDFDEQLNLAVTLTRALQVAGVNASVGFRDIADILRGQASIARVGGTALAGLMGFQSPQELDQFIQKAAAAGNLFQAIMDRMRGVKQTSEELGHTFTAELNRMWNALNDFRGNAAEPIMGPLTEGIKEFTAALKSDDAIAWARTVGGAFVDITKSIIEGTKALKDFIDQHRILIGVMTLGNSEAIRFLAGGVGGGLADAQQAQVEQLKLETLQKQTQELQKQIGAGGSIANANKTLQTLNSLIYEVQKEITAEENKGAAANSVLVYQLQNALSVLHQMVDGFFQAWGAAVKLQDAVRGIAPAAAEAIAAVRDKIKLLNDEASGNQEAVAADRAKVAYDEIYKTLVAKKVPEAEAVALAKEYSTAVEGAALHAQGLKTAHADVAAAMREEETIIQRIRDNQQLIQANPFLSADQKEGQSLASMLQEVQALETELTKLQSLRAGPLDPPQLEQVNQKIQQTQFEISLLGLKIAGLQAPLQTGLIQWANSFGTAIQQVTNAITGTLNTAISGTSSALTGLIFGTKNWQQAFLQAAESIVQSIIKIALQFVISRLLMSVLDRQAGATDAGAATAQASIAAAAWAGPATSASIATFGAAAATGLSAYLSALAAGTAAGSVIGGVGAVGGFEGGGFTGGSPGVLAGFVHGQEFVFSAPAVRNVGRENLEAAHSAALGLSSPGGAGGGSGSGSAARGHVSNHALFLDVKKARQWLFDSEGEKFLVDVIKGSIRRL